MKTSSLVDKCVGSSLPETVISPACLSLIEELVQLAAFRNTKESCDLQFRKHMGAHVLVLESRHLSLKQISGSNCVQLNQSGIICQPSSFVFWHIFCPFFMSDKSKVSEVKLSDYPL